MKFKESQNTSWYFLNVLPLKATDIMEQKPRARRQWEELMFPMGSACYRSLKYKLGQGTSSAFTPAAPWRAAPIAWLCDSCSPRIPSGVHSKQITKLSPLEHFTTASSYLRGRHHLFQGSLHRAEYMFKSRGSLLSIAIKGVFHIRHALFKQAHSCYLQLK